MTFAATELDTDLEPLDFDTIGPRVVAIGGGHGLAITLQAVQRYAGHITGVVTVADDGGSSGRLTSGLGIPAPGDVRRCLLALTPEPSLFARIFGYRFQEADVEGHSLGNLVLAALTDLLGDFELAVRTAGDMLGAVGEVIPAANRPMFLSAVVGGRSIDGQRDISKARGGVESLHIGPDDVSATPRALEAIAGADQVVIGPGSLYTSVMAALMVPGIREAVLASSAQKVFVLNLIDQDGETLGLSGVANLAALEKMAGLGGLGDLVAHHGPLEVPAEHQAVSVTSEESADFGWRLVEADVADHAAEWPEHDAVALGEVLAGLALGES